MQVPVAATHSAIVAHGSPMLVHAVCAALQTSGWRPLQRVSPASHAAGLHVPSAELQSAAVSHGVPTFVQPSWVALHTCGCAPSQWFWPGVQVGASHTPASQSAAVAHAAPSFWYAV